MSRFRFAFLFLVAALAGCAQNPVAAPESKQAAGNLHRAKVMTDLAAAYLQRGEIRVALSQVRQAIEADKRYPEAYDVLGLIYMDLAEDKLAEENFRKALDLDPKNSDIHNNLGYFYCTRGRYKEGLEQLQRALQNPLYRTPELAMYNAGICHEKEGKAAEAEADFRRALTLRPDYGLAILSLAKLYYAQHRLAEAEKQMLRYGQLAHPTPQSLWFGVELERKLGDKAQENAYADQLRKLFPNSAEAQQLNPAP